MKTTTEKTTTHIQKVASYTCSRCGAPCGDDEERDYYETDEATIRTEVSRSMVVVLADGVRAHFTIDVRQRARLDVVKGSSYPEGTYNDAVVIDACVKCFREHAIPALIAAGFKTREEEREW